MGSGGQRAEGLARGAAGPAACGAGPAPCWAAAARRDLAGRLLQERNEAGWWGKKWPRAEAGLWAKTEKGERKFIFFLFLIFPKQVQNGISTQFETRLQPSNTEYYATA